jgi:hypothetical protein
MNDGIDPDSYKRSGVDPSKVAAPRTGSS